MSTWANNLFYIVFLGQILLTSYFVPKLILRRMDKLSRAYPRTTHSKLYPRSDDYYRIGHAAFKWANRLIFLLGFVVLVGIYALHHGNAADGNYVSQAWPAAYGVVQFVPLMALELLGFGQLKRMRGANSEGRRKAELRPRRMFDYVSPGLLMAAVAMLAAVIGLDLYVNDFALKWSSDAAQRDLVLVGTNLFLLALGLWYLLGRKLNPHQSATDRARQAKAQVTSCLLVSMAMSVYFMTQTTSDLLDFNALQATLMSLYFQLIVAVSIGFTLRTLKFEDIDFDVYANDTSTEKNNG